MIDFGLILLDFMIKLGGFNVFCVKFDAKSSEKCDYFYEFDEILDFALIC